MREVHIYAESETAAPRCMKRRMGYVLEYVSSGRTFTREEFYEDTGTYHAVILRALTKAVKRIKEPCELHIHTQDTFTLEMLDENLPYWAVNGYRTAKGKLIKNHFEWQNLFEASRSHLITKEAGMHTYYHWMLDEMKKCRKADKS